MGARRAGTGGEEMIVSVETLPMICQLDKTRSLFNRAAVTERVRLLRTIMLTTHNAYLHTETEYNDNVVMSIITLTLHHLLKSADLLKKSQLQGGIRILLIRQFAILSDLVHPKINKMIDPKSWINHFLN